MAFSTRANVLAIAGSDLFSAAIEAADAPRKPLAPGTSYARPDSQFAITQIRPSIFAISEPDYSQRNVSYVIVGEDRALVMDAGGTMTEDITAVVRRLTDKPFAVIPSHLHFDHIGGIYRFQEIWMIDVPATRRLVRPEWTYPGLPGYHQVATPEELATRPFKVSRYVKWGEVVELGDKPVHIIFTPGHTRDEIVVYSPLDNMLFTGDFLYPAGLFVGNAKDYLASVTAVLAAINPQTVIYGAHPGHAREGVSDLPLVRHDELVAVQKALQRAVQGAAPDEVIANPAPTGNFKMTSAKVFQATPQIRVLTDIVFADRETPSYPDGAAFR